MVLCLPISALDSEPRFEYEQNDSQGRGTRTAASRSVSLLAKSAGWCTSLGGVGCQRSRLCVRCRF
jgi:hypothetical protein